MTPLAFFMTVVGLHVTLLGTAWKFISTWRDRAVRKELKDEHEATHGRVLGRLSAALVERVGPLLDQSAIGDLIQTSAEFEIAAPDAALNPADSNTFKDALRKFVEAEQVALVNALAYHKTFTECVKWATARYRLAIGLGTWSGFSLFVLLLTWLQMRDDTPASVLILSLAVAMLLAFAMGAAHTFLEILQNRLEKASE